MKFIVKDANYSEVVMSPLFEDLAKPLMVEVIRRREQPQVGAVGISSLGCFTDCCKLLNR